MKNLKLGRKMLVLTLILMASMLAVAYVSFDRLSLVNQQVQQLVERTMRKQSLASELQVKLLASIRAQKNSIISTEDVESKEFADLSRAELTEARQLLDKLKGIVAQDRSDGQSAAADALDKALEAFQKINNEALDLSLLNTNVKARALLSGDLQRNVDIDRKSVV